MDFISSDTNVWLDFSCIGRIEYPFRLPYVYLMHDDSIKKEFVFPQGLGTELQNLGLVPVELETEEFFLADDYAKRYPSLSTQDRVALAIAKCRSITLLTGDGALRKASLEEHVSCVGTIWILDQLYDQGEISVTEYLSSLCELRDLTTKGERRLPKAALEERIEKCLRLLEQIDSPNIVFSYKIKRPMDIH